jgi:hypothetical protein
MRNLESLVSEFSAFEASNPLDVIYGVLALASDTRSSANKRALGSEIAMPPNADGKLSNAKKASNPESSAPTITLSPSTRKRKGSQIKTSSRKRQPFKGKSPTPMGNSPNPGKAELLSFTGEEIRLVKLFMNKIRSRIAQKLFKVDYDKTFFEVCKDFLIFVIRKSKNLDILCRP